MCVSRCVWSSVVIQLCMAQFSCDSGVCMCVYVHWCGSVVCGTVHMWFSIGSVVVQLCTAWFRCYPVLVQVWVGVCVQVCVVQCCDSVVHGTVQL